eukprot:1161670-Pelagomonas_calceolata.AAC.4
MFAYDLKEETSCAIEWVLRNFCYPGKFCCCTTSLAAATHTFRLCAMVFSLAGARLTTCQILGSCLLSAPSFTLGQACDPKEKIEIVFVVADAARAVGACRPPTENNAA